VSLDDDTTRIDTFASYGQLLTDDYVRNGSRSFGGQGLGREDEDSGADGGFLRQPDDAPPPQQQQQEQRRQRESNGGGAGGSAAAPSPQRASRGASPRSALLLLCRLLPSVAVLFNIRDISSTGKSISTRYSISRPRKHCHVLCAQSRVGAAVAAAHHSGRPHQEGGGQHVPGDEGRLRNVPRGHA